MDTFQKRVLLFLVGCIGVRLLLVYIAKTVNIEKLRYFGYLAILPAIGFAVIYLFGLRKTGAEVFGEKIWWNNLRPIHAFLWGLFAYYAIIGNRAAWMILLLDVIIGLGSFLWHHFLRNN
jgi:hypothetical protein